LDIGKGFRGIARTGAKPGVRLSTSENITTEV